MSTESVLAIASNTFFISKAQGMLRLAKGFTFVIHFKDKFAIYITFLAVHLFMDHFMQYCPFEDSSL